MSLNQSPEVVRIANSLGIYQHPRPVDGIVEFCFGRVNGWIQEFGGVDSLARLEKLVCAKLRLKFEYVESDADVERIRDLYTKKGEPVIKSILEHLDEQTFGAVFERIHATTRDADRYVAVIDCRGDKRARKFFTKWHEIAHLLTLKGQLDLVLNRANKEKKPEEQLMDVIAGRVGFHPSVFKRAFDAELAAYRRFDFGCVQRVRDNVCPEASYQSTLHACVEALAKPCLLVEIRLGLSKAEQAFARSGQRSFLPEESPIPVLRAISTHANSAARAARFSLHSNMRVPADSHLYRAFQEQGSLDYDFEAPRREDMAIWQHSDGRGLATREVTVVSRFHGQTLFALMIAD